VILAGVADQRASPAVAYGWAVNEVSLSHFVGNSSYTAKPKALARVKE
jgi:hypothetical protein